MPKIKSNWICLDCGIDCSKHLKNYYMLKHDVWKRINPQINGMLCVGCCENRLRRNFIADDILVCPLTEFINPYTKSILLAASKKIN